MSYTIEYTVDTRDTLGVVELVAVYSTTIVVIVSNISAYYTMCHRAI